MNLLASFRTFLTSKLVNHRIYFAENLVKNSREMLATAQTRGSPELVANLEKQVVAAESLLLSVKNHRNF